eukprot:CAMPEP_0174886166 /NCGR_PEP_ID=MMETSP0167-20121228/1433_1 /TAXON_ID=38298 /ORGANISM="Rhodella maculata, Strain CCMP736" /LENGTH=104 /DNA_ID=CAMNT_0016122053 /DNA_START=143 /DNA_END=453 /DNA_ORIENTATION=-
MGVCELHSRCFSRALTRVDFGTAPITVSTFSPPLITTKLGMLFTSNLPAVAGHSSVFTLISSALPASSAATSSSTGAIIRHGPHHGAQKYASTVLEPGTAASSS